MLNTKFMYNEDYEMKTLTKNKLLELINSLPDDTILGANRVGNISIFQKDKPIGFIDMENESIELE